MDTDPPVTEALPPAFNVTRPPEDVSPVPTPILMLPPVPDDAEPVDITRCPLLPLEE